MATSPDVSALVGQLTLEEKATGCWRPASSGSRSAPRRATCASRPWSTLPAPSLAPPLGEMSTLEEWLADPAGRAVPLTAAGTDEAGRPLGPLGEENLVKVIGSVPTATLAAFPNLGSTTTVCAS